jgi:mono/diheme cytochrome c family protein
MRLFGTYRLSDFYQILLILSGLLVTALFAVFFYRELFPEYKIYQEDYLALEEFRSTYTSQPAPLFSTGVKQLVLEREDRGPPVIDRCTSCHVALQIPYFSPTKIAKDINGNIIRNEQGQPILVPNEDYIWAKLDEKAADLRNVQMNEELRKQGKEKEVSERLKQADRYEALKVAYVGEHVYDVTKVLAMHPLMGKETRPFEFHPVEEYGCTTCHNGNGRGLTTDKAHGPVFDGQYEAEFRGPVPQFTEPDPHNDPSFARVFNEKPGHGLLFQTQPIFVGALIQAKCMQCHQTSEMQLQTAAMKASNVSKKKQSQIKLLQESFEKDKETLLALADIQKQLSERGLKATVEVLNKQQQDVALPEAERSYLASQASYLKRYQSEEQALQHIRHDMMALLGSQELVQQFQQVYNEEGSSIVDPFLKDHQLQEGAKGLLFSKAEAIDYEQDILLHVRDTQDAFQNVAKNQKVVSALTTDIDDLTRHYRKGQELFFAQACYACHRIAGLSRGGIGPELTREGESYPWFIKESIVWPQADLKTSTMPNMRLDHPEVENLMTFLLAQRGSNKALSQTEYRAAIQSWEAGRKMPWEEPVPAAKIRDVRYGMKVFATEGCAACHRLLGFDSDVGFAVEQEEADFDQVYDQQRWFKSVFPEVVAGAAFDQSISGSEIVAQIEKHAQEIDKRIKNGVRQQTILEEIEQEHPGLIESYYSNFKYAARAKNHYYDMLIKQESDPEKKEQLRQELLAWKDRVHRVLMMYIQQYGLGRLIGPRSSWSGVFRTDEWLMEHFRNPSAHVPRSIMPVFPFDDTKFYTLTYMLDVLGIRNRNAIREVWEKKGFSAEEAYDLHCAQCHGLSKDGTGPVSEWIYPIPKSLRSPEFLRNLTKERALFSILHGVPGTPMPPWGEVAQDKPASLHRDLGKTPVLTEKEAGILVDWLFSSLPGGEVLRAPTDVLKWQYTPEDILDELRKEGGSLESDLPSQSEGLKPSEEHPDVNNPAPEPDLRALLPSAEGYFASLKAEISPKKYKDPEPILPEHASEIFDRVPNTRTTEPEEYSYYIKKKYYTERNLEEGRRFFSLNCAVCHGNEADGSGARAQAMQEAKPRMLINLDWLNSRDDLRLLRSIKYGVPGTSMTPWGDLTSSLQRLQLVMFIRSLSENQSKKSQMDALIYKSYDESLLTIEHARANYSENLEKLRLDQKELEARQKRLEHFITEGKEDPQEGLQNYEQLLKLNQEIKQLEEKDQQLVALQTEVKKEKDLYQILGTVLLSKELPEGLFDKFLQSLALNEKRYSLNGQGLQIHLDSFKLKKLRQLQTDMTEQLNQKIKELERKRVALQAQIVSAQRNEELAANEADIKAYKKMQERLISNMEEAHRSVQRQEKIVQSLQPERLE